MRKPAILLFTALALAACKTTQQPAPAATSDPVGNPVETAAQEAGPQTPEAAALPVIGTWKVTELTDLRLPDPEMAGMVNDIRTKIIADLRMEILADSTYTISGFDGLTAGKWDMDGNDKLYLRSSVGETDVITFSKMGSSEMKGTLRTDGGVTGKFTYTRVD